MPPVYFFVIDVSVSAINSGMVATAAAAIKSCLDRLPGADRTRIGFLTYDNHLHFYNLKSSLTQPQMMVRCLLLRCLYTCPDRTWLSSPCNEKKKVAKKANKRA